MISQLIKKLGKLTMTPKTYSNNTEINKLLYDNNYIYREFMPKIIIIKINLRSGQVVF